jgi:hypothetical protein
MTARAASIAALVWYLDPGAGRILLVVPGHRLQQDRAVLDRPCHRAGVVEGEGERQDTVAAHQAVGRLYPRDAAEGGGAADRAAGIGAGRAKDQAAGERSAAAAGRTAGEVVGVPGIACRRPWKIEGRSAHGELMRGELAEEHRPGL